MSQMLTAQIDRTKQPVPDPPPTATFPHYEEFTLKNGLKVFFVRDERPLVTFRMLVRGGNGQDGDVPGLSDAVADLLTKGTTSRSALEFAQQLDFIGANINVAASPDAISITAGGLKRHMPKILELFADAVKNPSYAMDELQKYQQEQITGLKSSKARSEFLAEYAVNKVLYGETPYGQMPTEQALRALTPPMLEKFHDSYFVPSNTTLAFVGDISKDELKNVLDAAFGDWKTGNAPTIKAPTFPNQKGRRIVLVDRPTAVQSSIRVVGKGPLLRDNDRPMTFILNSILGGGTGLGNRLAMNLRETHAYTYTPYSTFDANYYKGHFIAGAEVRNEVTDSALKEIFYEIDRLEKDPVPADELGRNKQSAVGNFLMSIADPTTTAVRVQSINFYGLPKDYYEKLADAYNATTIDHVTKLAQKYLNSDDLSVVVVGKASEVKSKLEQFGTVEVWNADLQPMAAPGTRKDMGNMNAGQVWDKMLTAMGGKEKLRAVKSLKMTATVNASFGAQSMSGKITRIQAAPNKGYMLTEMAGSQLVISDGKDVRIGGMGQPNLRSLEGEERDMMLEQSYMLPEAYLQEMKGKLELTDLTDVNGRKAYAVNVAYPNSAATYYIDAETFLPIVRESPLEGRIVFRDWKPSGGITLSHAFEMEPQPGVVMAVSGITYEVDGPVDESIFNKK